MLLGRLDPRPPWEKSAPVRGFDRHAGSCCCNWGKDFWWAPERSGNIYGYDPRVRRYGLFSTLFGLNTPDHIWRIAGSRLDVSYDKDGVLYLSCFACGWDIASLAVADGPGTSNVLTRAELDKTVYFKNSEIDGSAFRPIPIAVAEYSHIAVPIYSPANHSKVGQWTWPTEMASGRRVDLKMSRLKPHRVYLESECHGWLYKPNASYGRYQDCRATATYNQETGALTWTCCDSFSVAIELAAETPTTKK